MEPAHGAGGGEKMDMFWSQHAGLLPEEGMSLGGWHGFRSAIVGQQIHCMGGFQQVVFSPTLLYTLDVAKKKWSKRRVFGDVPGSIMNNPCVLVNDRLFSIGTGFRLNSLLTHLFAIDLGLMQWQKVELKGDAVVIRNPPVADFWESGKAILINCNANTYEYTQHNDTFIFSLESDSLTKLVTKGPSPTLRSLHSSYFAEDLERWFIVGGMTQAGNRHGTDEAGRFNDMYILDLQIRGSPLWTQLFLIPQIKGVISASFVVFEGIVVVFGGNGQRRRKPVMYRYHEKLGLTYLRPSQHGESFSSRFRPDDQIVHANDKIYMIHSREREVNDNSYCKVVLKSTG